MQDATFLTALKSNPFFDGLTSDQINKIISLFKKKSFKVGEAIVKEGEKTSDLFFLFRGKVQLFKKVDNQKIEIGELSPYEIFGDISFIDETIARTLTVIAKEKVEVLVLKREDLDVLNEDDSYIIANRLTANIAKMNFERLNKTNQNYVQTLLNAIQELKLREEFGRFFAFVIGIVSLSSLVTAIIQAKKILPESKWFTWLYLVLALVPILYLIKHYHYRLQDFGVTLKNWGTVLLQSIAISIGVVSFLIIIAVIYRHFANEPQIFTLKYISWGTILLYIPHSYLQEFIARGVSQSLLVRFFNDKTGILSIVITALVFGDIHFYLSWLVAITVFLFSLLLGAVYLRQKNLIGVTIVHVSLGVVASILGYMY